MKKDEFIALYGEEAWEKKLEKSRAWYNAHPEEAKAKNTAWRNAHLEQAKALAKAWREAHPEKVRENQHEGNRKGGKYYEKMIAAQRIGIQRDKNRLRTKHRGQYHPYKMIIAPDSEIHHEWIPLSSEYRGLALVEAKPHQYGIIDVIQILDGTITVLTEEEVRNGKKKV